MRFSLIILISFLSYTFGFGQIGSGNQSIGAGPSRGLADCVQLIDFSLSSGLSDDLNSILQTGRPFGAQGGYTQILNKSPGCQGDGNLTVSFAKTGNCESTEYHTGREYYTASIYFNNKNVASVILEGIGNEVLTVPISQLGLDHVSNTPQVIPLELRIQHFSHSMGGVTWPTSYSYILAEVMVVDNDDQLFFEHETLDGYNSYTICNRVALGDLDDRLQNCSTTESITVTYSMTDFSSNASAYSFSAGYAVTAAVGSSPPNDGQMYLSGSVSGSTGQTVTFEEEEILSNSIVNNQALNLPPRSEEGCSFVGVELSGRREYIQFYTVNCNLLETGEISNDQFVYTSIQPTVCTAPSTIPEDCLPVMINFEITTHDYDPIMAGRDAVLEDCTVDITAFQEPVPEHFQTILWEGPDGYEAVGNNIQDVPIGIYTVTVYNECGEESVYTVDVCVGESVVSPWVFEESSGKFCRTVTCSGDEVCEGFTTQECITPEFGAWVYDPDTRQACRELYCPAGDECKTEPQCVTVEFGNWDYLDDGFETICFRDVLALGEVIAQDEHPAAITYEYNEFTNRCYRYTRCVDPWLPLPELVSTETEEPVFEEWDFDQFLEVCVRAVNCFNLSAEEVQYDPDIDFENPGNMTWEDSSNDPVYTWDYDVNWGCTGYVFCDAFEPAQHPVFTDWTLDQGQGTPVASSVGYEEQFGEIRCVLDVNCRFNGWEYDTPVAFPPLLSDPVQASNAYFIGSVENGGYCQYIYNCGNQAPYTLDQNFVGDIVGQDADGNDLCVAYCDGFRATTSQPAVLCSDIGGFVAGTNELKGVENPGFYQLKWQEESAKYGTSDRASPQLSPNPFGNEILLQNIPQTSEEVTAVLLDLNGKIVLEQHFKGVAQAKISTRHLVPGMYLFLMLGENAEILYERRLVKVKG